MPLSKVRGETIVVLHGDYKGWTGYINTSTANKPIQPHKWRVVLKDPADGTTVHKVLNKKNTRLKNAPGPSSYPRAIFHEHEDAVQAYRAYARILLQCGQDDVDAELIAAEQDLFEEEKKSIRHRATKPNFEK
jgi:hypothetical protein